MAGNTYWQFCKVKSSSRRVFSAAALVSGMRSWLSSLAVRCSASAVISSAAASASSSWLPPETRTYADKGRWAAAADALLAWLASPDKRAISSEDRSSKSLSGPASGERASVPFSE